nr:hypothetical protein [Tanacetum cinerariifolium]
MIYKIQKCDLEDAIEMRSKILGLFGANGERGGKIEVRFDNFREEERKLEIMVALVEEEVPYLEECVKDSLRRSRRSGKQEFDRIDVDCQSIRKGLFGPIGERGGKMEVRGRGSLAICSMESKDALGGGGLVAVGKRSSSVLNIAWGEVGGVENKSLMGSMLIAKGKECLDGWVRADGGKVKGGGVDLGVTKSLLGETPGESGDEEFAVDGGVV